MKNRSAETISLVILIVLYDKHIGASATINSLAKMQNNALLSQSKILVWNNGPKAFDEEDLRRKFNDRANIEIVQWLSNAPLSFVYNKCLDLDRAFMLMDDDTSLNETYLSSVCEFLNEGGEFFIPRIMVGENQVYPIVKKRFFGRRATKHLTVSSGMVLSSALLKRLVRKYGYVFDSRYALYGIDMRLCLNINNLDQVVVQIGPQINHNLSRYTEGKESAGRQAERVLEATLQLIHGPSFSTIKYFCFVFFLKAQLTYIERIRLALKVLRTGLHPRVEAHAKRTIATSHFKK